MVNNLWFLELEMLFQIADYTGETDELGSTGCCGTSKSKTKTVTDKAAPDRLKNNIDSAKWPDTTYSTTLNSWLSNSYAMMFNLNWGTADYNSMNGDQSLQFTALFNTLTKMVFGTKATEPDSTFKSIFPSYATETNASVKYLNLFLYQEYRQFWDEIKSSSSNEPADIRDFHWNYIKKLMFLSKYYMDAYRENLIFAGLVHQDAKLAGVLQAFKAGIKVFQNLADDYENRVNTEKGTMRVTKTKSFTELLALDLSKHTDLTARQALIIKRKQPFMLFWQQGKSRSYFLETFQAWRKEMTDFQALTVPAAPAH